ncbi:hypothetical protein [Legionella santicrucis]|uniref:hypothetical protein n=1 Tax=Legionella santicrucis TaxID=45074 RepID=UPI0007315E06|nr:hypothetical protein [Legionella santicrucis]
MITFKKSEKEYKNICPLLFNLNKIHLISTAEAKEKLKINTMFFLTEEAHSAGSNPSHEFSCSVLRLRDGINASSA